jgi:peptidoglycan/LPS O-acetylase OafA/YrhL
MGKSLSDTRSNKLDGIESLRAVAALMIVLYHMVLLPNPNIQLPSYLWVIKEKFGMGVPLFYALSGFVLAFGYLGKLENKTAIAQFYVRRYFRIAPLFYLMIFVWLVAGKVKWGSFTVSFQDIFLNLSFLFGLAPGRHESIVWAGWSIGVEMLFYGLFPLIALFVTNLRSGILAYVLCVLIGSSFYQGLSVLDVGSYAYLNVITHLPNFLAGILAFLIWNALGRTPNRTIGAVLLCLVIASIYVLVYVPTSFQVLTMVKGVRLDLYAWSLVFIFLILSVCFWPNPLVSNSVATYLGKISFSLYLWHPLIVVLLLDVYLLFGRTLGTGLLNFMACVGITLISLVCVASISFRFVEKPGIAYGKNVFV